MTAFDRWPPQRDRVEIGSEFAAGQPIEELKLAGLIPQPMPLLQLGHELPLLEAASQRDRVRRLRLIENAGPRGPPVLIPFGGSAVGVAP